MKTVLQWVGAAIILIVLAFFGMQVYTSQTFCKTMIDKNWTYDIAQVFYSPIKKSCYFAIKVYEDSSSCYALGGDWPSCTGTKIPTGRLNVFKLKNNGVERTDIGSSNNIIVKLLNMLGFGPVGYDTSKQTEKNSYQEVEAIQPADANKFGDTSPGVEDMTRAWNDQSGLDTKFIPGIVIVGFKDSVSLREAFAIVVAYGDYGYPMAIDENTHATYFIGSGNDEEYLKQTIREKKYISSVSTSRHYITNEISIYPRFTGMKDDDRNDRFDTVDKLQLEGGPAGSIVLSIPIGREDEYIKLFQQREDVEWAELNQIIKGNGNF